MSQPTNKPGRLIGMLVNIWTIATLALNLTGVTHLSWWLVFGPWLTVLVLGLVAAVILGFLSIVEDK